MKPADLLDLALYLWPALVPSFAFGCIVGGFIVAVIYSRRGCAECRENTKHLVNLTGYQRGVEMAECGIEVRRYCPHCKGLGEFSVPIIHAKLGPDVQRVWFQCPECKGTGGHE